MSTNKEDTLRQFCDVTGADETRSKFFLESSNWQLEVALSSFYEHGGNLDEAPSHPAATPAALPQVLSSDSEMESPPESPLHAKKDKKKPANTKFATLDSLRQESSSDDEEEETLDIDDSELKKKLRGKREEIKRLKEDIERSMKENCELRKEIAKLKGEEIREDDKQGQAFYAGGSERSGQQILGPSKGRKDIVSEVFNSVRQRGAVVFEDEPSSTRGRGGAAFSGAGYRLGQTSDDHEQVTPGAGQGTQAQEGVRSVRLRLYREGFTIDSGPLRHYADHENAEFLNCIRRGEIPPELAVGRTEVRVSLEDHRMEECPRGQSKPQVFQGKGHMLGSPTPPTVGATASVAAAPLDREANQRAAQQAVGLNDAQPVTTIQFRLADGSRLTGRFNLSHTVEDIRNYIARAEPQFQLQSFALVTSYPSAELTDTTATIEKAKLNNSTLLLRLK